MENNQQKSKKILINFFKFFKVLSVIGFAFSCIAFVGGIIMIAAMGSADVVNTINAELEMAGETLSRENMLCAGICMMISFAAAGVLCWFNRSFYARLEVADKYFTKETSKNLKLLAILHLALPIAASFICAIIVEALQASLNFTMEIGISLGIVYLVAMCVVNYVVDEKSNAETKAPAEAVAPATETTETPKTEEK